MIRKVAIHRQVEKHIEVLSRGHKKAALAARKALEIIDALVSQPDFSRMEAGSCTRYGEARLQNCVKFDLGAGYRLVTIREDDCLHFVYLNSHDECDRWLEKQSGTDRKNLCVAAQVILTRERLDPKELFDEDGQDAPSIDDGPDYEDLLKERISDKDIEEVFAGLRRGVSHQS